jgi:short-subunit dehydrogenase
MRFGQERSEGRPSIVRGKTPGSEAQGSILAKKWGKAALNIALTGGGPLMSWPLRHRLFGAPGLRQVVTQKTVLVSGASSGIGHAVALQLASAGARVVVVARSADKLRALKAEIERSGGCALIYAADLSSAQSTEGLLARLAADRVVIDVLVNNAGRSIRRSVDDASLRLHDYERTMALNYFGAIRLILGLLPGMRARGQGHVINVSSSGTQMGTPLFSAYIASKAALDAFTRVAASETRHHGVRFTTVLMPLVRTPMIAPTAEYRDAPALTPDEAAQLVLRALVTGETRLSTRLGKLFGLGHAIAPALVERMLAAGHRLVAEPTAESLPADGPVLRRAG